MNRDPRCGDASACLKLRTSVTRRDRGSILQDACPIGIAQNPRKTNPPGRSDVLDRCQRPVTPGRDSVRIEIPIDLPRGNLADVFVPLLAFRGDEAVEYVVPECLTHQRALLEFVEC